MNPDEYTAALAQMDRQVAEGHEMVDLAMKWTVQLREEYPDLNRTRFLAALALYAGALHEGLTRRDLVLMLTMLIDRLSAAEVLGVRDPYP